MDADDKHDFESVGADVEHTSQDIPSASQPMNKTHNQSRMVIKSVKEMRNEPPSLAQSSLAATTKEHQCLHKIKNQHELCVEAVSPERNFLEFISMTDIRAVEEAVGGRVHRLTTQVVIWRQ